MSSFCTNLRMSKCSHRFTMLRFCRLSLAQNSLNHLRFFSRSDWLIAQTVSTRNAHIGLLYCAFATWLCTKNNIIIYDFLVLIVLFNEMISFA